MENNTVAINFNDIEKLKLDFENGKIREDQINKDEALLISVLYELQLMDIEEKIQDLKEEISNYKNRMKKAIEYLKNKKK